MSSVLSDVASQLAELIATWQEQDQLRPADLVGAFIVAAVALVQRHKCREKQHNTQQQPQKRQKGRWAAGRLQPQQPLKDDNNVCDSDVHDTDEIELYRKACVVSAPVASVSGLPELLGLETVQRWTNKPAPTLADVFKCVRLIGVKADANSAMCNWYFGRNRFVLLHYIPSPLEVLQMQAVGERVVTLFVTSKELAGLHTAPLEYMDGQPLHSRNALEFLLHDLTHMEKFMSRSVHEEQVGYFRCMAALGNGNPRGFFSEHGGDEKLWRELEYVLSDMNCWSTHLLSYTKAKLLLCAQRTASDSSHSPASLSPFGTIWPALISEFGLVGEGANGALVAAERLCNVQDPLESEVFLPLRHFFRDIGRITLQRQAASEADAKR